MHNNKQEVLKLFAVEEKNQVKVKIFKKSCFINKSTTQKLSIAPTTLIV